MSELRDRSGSDRFEPLFDGLRGQRPPAPFAPATAVRRRGRQRARRQAVAVSVAVLAVTGLGAGGVATAVNAPGPAPPPAATGSPAPTEPAPATPAPDRIPADWLLTADDLGPGEWVTGGFEPEWTESDPPWSWGNLCDAYPSEGYPSLFARAALQTVTWTDGPWEGLGGPRSIPNWVHQVVELFETGAVAAANLGDVRDVVGRCGRPVTVTPGVEAPRFEVVDSGFAGDESLLVLERQPGDVSVYTAVVRVGAAVTTLESYDVELARADDDYLRAVARSAAARLQ